MTIGILPNVNSTSLTRVINSATSARLHTGRLRENPAKKPKKDGDKSAVAILKDVRQLGCVLQDTELAKSLSILRKSSKVLGPRRQECCGYCEKCTTIGLRLARLGSIGFSERKKSRGNPMQRVLEPIKGCDSSSLHLKRVSGKRKDHRWVK